MIETATGLVLRTRPLTETSLVVQWLTPELGRLATVAKGARRPKSPFHGKLDLFYLADFSFVRSRHSELHTLREVSLRKTHRPLREELGYLQQAAYCAGFVEQTTEVETPVPEVFELMLGLLTHLPAQPPHPQTVFVFELKMLKGLGLSPDLEQTRLSAGAKQLTKALMQNDWPMTARLEPSAAQIGELRHFLGGFLAYHLGKEPKGRNNALSALAL